MDGQPFTDYVNTDSAENLAAVFDVAGKSLDGQLAGFVYTMFPDRT